MNEPMDAKRRAKLVRMVEEEMWDELSAEWTSAQTPFGYLATTPEAVQLDNFCGCPSQVRFSETRSDLLAEHHAELLADELIPNMNDLLFNHDKAVHAQLTANPGAIFDRFEHYQRLVTS